MTTTSLSIIQLNIERERHLDRFLPFLAEQNADVVLLQEVMESHLPTIAVTAGEHYVFAPMYLYPLAGELVSQGIALFSKHPLKNTQTHYYHGNTDADLDIYDRATPRAERRKAQRNMVVLSEIEKENATFRIGTTHFPVVPDGKADDHQRQCVKKLLDALAPYDNLVLAGDFNAPRGGEIYETLAEAFTDNVPPHYQTSLDRDLHRAGHLDRMVDYIFSRDDYAVADVAMHCGVSDHCALVGNISQKVQKEASPTFSTGRLA